MFTVALFVLKKIKLQGKLSQSDRDLCPEKGKQSWLTWRDKAWVTVLKCDSKGSL